MKQSLDLQLGQHLTITPQLQQAIRLLQLSSIELQQEIQEALETNPLLEESEDDAPEQKSNEAEQETDGAPEAVLPDSGSLQPTDMEMDRGNVDDTSDGDGEGDWSETFDVPLPTASRGNNDDFLLDIDARNSRPQTLRDHLHWQMQMTPFSDMDREIALAIIDSISEDGYLACGLEEIRQILAPDHDVELEESEDDAPEQKSNEAEQETDGAPEAVLPDSGSLQPTDMEMDRGNVDDTSDGDGEGDWSETFDVPLPTASRGNNDDFLLDIDARNSRPQTLRDHLHWQMQMTPFSDMDREIALAIIDSISEDGYLACGLEEIRQILAPDHDVELDEIEAVLVQRNSAPGRDV